MFIDDGGGSNKKSICKQQCQPLNTHSHIIDILIPSEEQGVRVIGVGCPFCSIELAIWNYHPLPTFHFSFQHSMSFNLSPRLPSECKSAKCAHPLTRLIFWCPQNTHRLIRSVWGWRRTNLFALFALGTKRADCCEWSVVSCNKNLSW